MLDIPATLGKETLTDKDVIGVDVVKLRMAKQGTDLGRGDIALV